MTDTSTTSSPFNKWWGIAAGAILIVIILGVLLITGALGGGSEPAPTTPAATIAPSENPPPVGATLCEVPGANDSIPTIGPEAEWATNIYFLYPTSSTFGPVGNPSSDLWGCFQKSPTGALFAAANATSALGSENSVEIFREAALSGEALEEWVEARLEQPGQAAGEVAQIAGFQFVSVEESEVTVNVGLRQSPVEASVTITVVWDENSQNWKVAMDKSSLNPVQADVDVFTAWAAT